MLPLYIKKWYGWYFRKNIYGCWVLDSTHEREYSGPEQIKRIIESAGFKVKEMICNRLRFSIVSPIFRNVLKENNIFLKK